LSFNWTKSKVVFDLLTGHNTLRRHVMGLNNNTLCRRSGAEEETSVHILHEGETLASLRHIQGGAELTDTFQMVIDNIWKKRKNKRNRL